ncbi:unnamed protein product [Pylaiella littoralis]
MVKDSGKWFPLHSALIFGDLAAAKELIDKGANEREMLTRSNGKGWRAVHFACHSGDNNSVAWLVGLEACDPSVRTALGETALHLSAVRGDERMCQTLLDGGCPPEAVTREGKTALHLAAGMGHLHVTRLLVVGAGLSPSTPDGGGASAAALALAGNHKAVVRLLQKNCPGVPMGVPKKSSSNTSGFDHLTKGRKGGRGQRRLRGGGGVSFGGDGGGRGKGSGGRKRGDLKRAEEAGSRLLEAARVGDTMAMRRVLARGEIDVEWVGSSNGWTAVMEAAEHGSLEGVCYLLDMGADLERTNKKGLTPLQLAVRSGHLGVTEELLIRGARPNIISKAGLCLRCLASSAGHGYLADWLFAMGVADGVDGGCACSGSAKDPGGNGGGGGAAAAAAAAAASSGNDARTTRQHSSGAVSDGAPPDPALTSEASMALTAWLANLGLGAYAGQLVSQGFDTLEAMGTVTEPDLEAMGFKKGHLRLLLARAPSASDMSGSNNNGGGGGVRDGIDSRINAEGPAAAISRSGSTPSTTTAAAAAAATRDIGVLEGMDNPVESGTRAAGHFAARPADNTEYQEENGEEDGEGRYCDASVLQPSRPLSLGGDGENNGGKGGGGGGGGGGDGFKELMPEEVEIDHVIGEGSFGVVRRARWRGMDVAVKTLKDRTASAVAAAAAAGTGARAGAGGVDGGATAGAGVSVVVGRGVVDDFTDGQEDMRHEARMLAKVCNHNCVVQFVGVLLRPVPSVVTMFMENGSVEDMLVSTDSPATKDLVVRMAIEAAKGVIHLHREGVVHRDLASRNLLLDDGYHVRISDFGFSRVKRECASRGYTRSDMGPIKWTSPEAMRKRCYSEASDAFSFGVVLYEMFARSPPWEGHENLDVAFRVCSGERMAVPPRVDPPIACLMNKCWDGNSRLRPDFASILTALTMFAGDQKNNQAGEEGTGAAALVAAAPSPPPPPPRSSSKKSAAAVKTARAKAEAAALAKAAVAELRRRRSATLSAAAAGMQRLDYDEAGGGGNSGSAGGAAEAPAEMVMAVTAPHQQQQEEQRRRTDGSSSSTATALLPWAPLAGRYRRSPVPSLQRAAIATAAAATAAAAAAAASSPVSSDARGVPSADEGHIAPTAMGTATTATSTAAAAAAAVSAATVDETMPPGHSGSSSTTSSTTSSGSIGNSTSSRLPRQGSSDREAAAGRGGGGGGGGGGGRRERGRGRGRVEGRGRTGPRNHDGRSWGEGLFEERGLPLPAGGEGFSSRESGRAGGGGGGGAPPHPHRGEPRPPLSRQLSGRGGGQRVGEK